MVTEARCLGPSNVGPNTDTLSDEEPAFTDKTNLDMMMKDQGGNG